MATPNATTWAHVGDLGLARIRGALDYDDTAPPVDGQVPTWDGATGKYRPAAPADAAGGGGYRSGFVPADQGTQPVVAHNLGTADVAVTVQDVNGRVITEVPVETVDATGAASDNHVRWTFTTAPTAQQYRYVILSAAPGPTVADHTHTGYAPAIHAGQHADGGADPVTPAAIGAAPSSHTHPAPDLSGYVPTSRQVTAGSGLTGGGALSADRSLAVSWGSSTPSAVAAAGAVGAATTAARSDHTHPGVPTSRTVSAGTGLTGGGDLSANRSFAVAYGSTAGTSVQGNDARVTADQAPGTASIRTLGTGSQQAAPGNHTGHDTPLFVGRQTIAQNMLANVGAPIALDTIDVDTLGGSWSSAQPTRYTVQRAGWYLITGSCAYLNAGDYTSVEFRKNGATFPGSTVYWHVKLDVSLPAPSPVIYLAVGDYVELWGSTGTASSNTHVGGDGNAQPHLRAAWLRA